MRITLSFNNTGRGELGSARGPERESRFPCGHVFTNRLALLFIVAILLILLPCSIMGQASPLRDLYQWQSLPELPYVVYGALVGISNEALIVAGGCSRPVSCPGEKIPENTLWLDTIAMLDRNSQEWIIQHKLPHPLAYGTAVNYQNHMILVGGRDDEKCYACVWQLTWDPVKKGIDIQSLPDLMEACAYTGGAVIERTIYVTGGVTDLTQAVAQNNLWSLEPGLDGSYSRWKIQPGCPDLTGCIQPLTVAQSNGDKECLYIFGGRGLTIGPGGIVRSAALRRSFRYEPFQKNPHEAWVKVESPPISLSDGNAFALGQSHIMIFPSQRFSMAHPNVPPPSSLLAYHTITNTWVDVGPAPRSGIGDAGTIHDDQIMVLAPPVDGSSATPIFMGILNHPKMSFGLMNYITLGVYLLAMVGMGFYFSKREKSIDDYFLAGKRIPGWAAGISIFATALSAITMLGTPAKAFATNWLYFFTAVALLPIMPFVAYLYLPFVKKLNVTTAYEYLEKRFNKFVRLFGSLVFVLFQIARMAVVLLLPAMALSTTTGIPVDICILLMGVLCILYTILGGIEAVIWTDVVQLIVLVGAIIIGIFVIMADVEGGFSTIIHTAKADHKFQLVHLSWDFTVPALWVILVGNFLSNLAPYISDQSVVQRYLTTPDIKEARKSLWFNFWFTIPCEILVFFLGTALYVFYKTNPSLLHPAIKTDAIFPWFVVQKMPAGVCGLVIAGIFAASMSSLDSAMHSVATAIINDFYLPVRPRSTDKHRLRLSRWVVGILGVFGTGSAMYLSRHDILSLWDFFMTLLGLLGGGLSGIFLLGIFTRRTHGTGAFLGAIVSAIMVFVIQSHTSIHFFLYGAIGVVVSVLVGYGSSLVLPAHNKDLEGLTIYTMNKERN